MMKKIFNSLVILCVAVFFTGCSDNSPKTASTKQIKTEKTQTATAPTVKLYGEDLKISQDEFISVYNDVLKNLAKDDGANYDNLKITLDDPANISQTTNGATHFYSGERGFISLFRNTAENSTICAAMITAKTNYKLPEMLFEVEALIQAVTQKQNNFKNIMDFVKNSLQSKTSNATNIDGLVVSYNDVGNYLTIIAEDATVGNGFEKMVDNVIDSAKMGGYWRK